MRIIEERWPVYCIAPVLGAAVALAVGGEPLEALRFGAATVVMFALAPIAVVMLNWIDP